MGPDGKGHGRNWTLGYTSRRKIMEAKVSMQLGT